MPSIFSEWMSGGSLKEMIAGGSLYAKPEETQKTILDIAIQVVSGLAYSHDRKLVHQDVKPGNILLSESGEAKPWMDVYAFGATLLEMYAGKRLWERGEEIPAFLERIASACRVPVPAPVLTFIRECLSSRQADCHALFRELKNIYREVFGISHLRPEPENVFSSANTLNNRALSFLDLGKPDVAAALFAEGLDMEPDNPSLVYNASLCRWRDGQLTDTEPFSTLQSNDFFLHTAQGQEMLREAAKESGKASIEEPLFSAEEHPFMYTIKNPHLCKYYNGKLYCPSSSPETEKDRTVPSDLLIVYDPETGNILEKHKLCLAGGETVKAVFLSNDCRYAVLVSPDYMMHFYDLKTGEITGQYGIEEPGSMYNSYSRMELIGKNGRFFNGLISFGLGHSAPKPVVLDLAEKKSVDEVWDWKKIALDSGKEVSVFPGTYNEISDGLFAIPILQNEKGTFRCTPEGVPVALLGKRIKPLIKYQINDYVLRVCEDGTFWRIQNSSLMQWNAFTGRCIRTYNARGMTCLVDSDGTSCVGYGHQAKGWKFRKFAPLSQKAGFRLSRIESYADYLSDKAKIARVYAAYCDAQKTWDTGKMCEAYNAGTAVPLFFGSAEQRTMQAVLNNTKGVYANARFVYRYFSGNLPETPLFAFQDADILSPFHLEKYTLPDSVKAALREKGFAMVDHRSVGNEDHILLTAKEKNTGEGLLFDLNAENDTVSFLNKNPTSTRFARAAYSRSCSHLRRQGRKNQRKRGFLPRCFPERNDQRPDKKRVPKGDLSPVLAPFFRLCIPAHFVLL